MSISISNGNVEKYLKWPNPEKPGLTRNSSGKYTGQPTVVIYENFKIWNWKKDTSGKYVYKIVTEGIKGIPEIKQRVDVDPPYKLQKGKDYTVSFNNTTGVMTVKGIGNYTGNVTCNLANLELVESSQSSEFGTFTKKLRNWRIT